MAYQTDRRRADENRRIRYVILAACIAVMIISFAGAHLYGRYLATLDEKGQENAIDQLRAQAEKLKQHGDDLSAQITQLQGKLASLQAVVDSVMPSKDTYNFEPNQTRIVANGRLVIGLIGPPGNENVTLNINGKQQTVAAGQFLNVDANCRVGVQSFDMFKAIVTASCAGSTQQ